MSVFITTWCVYNAAVAFFFDAMPSLPADLKWLTRQRLEFIETMAWYAGVVTRGDIARAFGLSEPAATKDLQLYGALAPGNLVYQHSVFGFVPTAGFSPRFADLHPAHALVLMRHNRAVSSTPYGTTSIFGIPTASLALPGRLPDAPLLAAITRAIRQRRQLACRYRSLTRGESERLIEPHTLVDTGLRWHVRAYSPEHADFRDFVLGRFVAAECLTSAAESAIDYDEDWMETHLLKLQPHPRLPESARASLILDFDAPEGCLHITERRALLAYTLRALGVDTTPDASRDPAASQLWLANREEVAPYVGWLGSTRAAAPSPDQD